MPKGCNAFDKNVLRLCQAIRTLERTGRLDRRCVGKRIIKKKASAPAGGSFAAPSGGLGGSLKRKKKKGRAKKVNVDADGDYDVLPY
jgi:hypothetical protein